MPLPPDQHITARRLFDGRSLHGPSRVTLSRGMVSAVEPWEGATDFDLLAPGLVDLQMNGWDGHDVASLDHDSAASLDASLLERGTTRWLATVVTDRLDRLMDRLRRLADVLESAPGCIGIHVEGPFLGSRPGAHDADRIVPPDLDWIDRLPASVKLVTLGAERPESAGAVRALRERGIVASLGHTAPTDGQWEAAVEAGARMVTHLFNAMSGVHHRDEGMALNALTDERVMIGLIGDTVHVSPRAVRLSFASAADRICLVSDSVAWSTEGSLRAGVAIRDRAPRLPDGTLAGSCTPLAECVRLAVTECGVDRALALRAATSNPAGTVSPCTAGWLRVGSDADLVAFDESLRVRRTWRGLQSVRGFPLD